MENEPQVVFEGEEFGRSERVSGSSAPKVVQWVMQATGLDERQAQYVLLGLVVLAIAVSVFLLFTGSGGMPTQITAPPRERVIYPANQPPRLERAP